MHVQGLNNSVIKQRGRWVCTAFQRYIRPQQQYLCREVGHMGARGLTLGQFDSQVFNKSAQVP